MDEPTSASASAAPDTLTLVAIAAVAGALATVLHEALGHGGACLLSGGQVVVVSSVHEECTVGNHWIDAGGTLINLLAGGICWALAARVTAPRWRYFLWLSMSLNLLLAAGYWLFSGVGNIGDWALVIAGRQPAWLWHAGMALIGGAVYVLFVKLVMTELRPFLDHTDPARWRRARRLCVVPYLTYGVLSCVAGVFNPVGPLLIAVSAAASSFGGASGLAWGWNFTRGPRFAASGPELAPLTRSRGWIVAGAVVAFLMIAALGPGLHPR